MKHSTLHLGLKSSFSSTRRKIALMFSMAAGVLMLSTTLIIILLVGYQMSLHSKQVLLESLEEISLDLQTDQLREVAINFQSLNPRVSRSVDYAVGGNELAMVAGSLPNIVDEANQLFPVKDKESKLVLDEDSFNKLKKNKQVYSRVILENGDILFSSDLFDTFIIDHTALGFNKYVVRDVCIYSQTAKVESGEHQGSVIQVAQYCPFTSSQQRLLMFTMMVATVFSSVFSYFIGYLMAGRFLKPLQESVVHTKAFAQNVYHELFTPVSVAITTVAATLRSRTYKEGLNSVNDDLTQIQESLQILSDSAFKTQAEITMQNIDISILTRNIIKNNFVNSSDNEAVLFSRIDTTNIKSNIKKHCNKASVELIIKNLINNACKYHDRNSVNEDISIYLSKKEFIIENTVENPEDISIGEFFTRYYRGENTNNIKGKGLGLSLVKELSNLQGWTVDASLVKNKVRLRIFF